LKKLINHLPEKAIPRIQKMLEDYSFVLKIVKERQTKHGDFRRLENGKFQITINENLNQYQFLLTLVHEIAHYLTFKNYGRVQPHGKEWKRTFKELMLPFVNPDIYPSNILPHLAKYLINPKASTDSDVNLALSLKQETRDSDKNYIFELLTGSQFLLKSRTFKILRKRRTRYLCLEIATNKKYVISQNTEVIALNN